jgi:hypothetical protein
VEKLNKILIEIDDINKKIYETDIYIRYHLKKLQDKFPSAWGNFLKIKHQWMDFKNINEEPLDNPLVKKLLNKNSFLERFKTKKCKELYRKISNITHPDKITNEYLNELFIIAKKHRNNNDLRSLENIYEIVQNELKEPSYDFISKKYDELSKQLKQQKYIHANQLVSFEYTLAQLYESRDEKNQLTAENMFIERLNTHIVQYLKEMNKNVH